MRILFLICALYVATAESAFAIKPASPEEIKDIQKQIFIGNRMDKEVSEAATALSDAKDAKAGDAEIKRREDPRSPILMMFRMERSVARGIGPGVSTIRPQPDEPRGRTALSAFRPRAFYL